MGLEIHHRSTVLLIEEFNDNNNAPLQFMCDDFNHYYLKYIIDDINEFDDLVYEVVCNQLAKLFKISSPEIAYVEASENSFELKTLKRNKFFFKPGVIAFGSQDIGANDTLDNTARFSIRNRRDFNKYENPIDLIRMSIFDNHISNQDRKEDNFNILIKKGEKGGKDTFYAIDHIHVFGGPFTRGNVKPVSPNINGSILKSNFFKQLITYIDLDEIEEELKNYLYLCGQIPRVINEVFETIPTTWQVSSNLKEKLIQFLVDKTRNEQLEIEYLSYIRYLKINTIT